jgi:hypothetical protein
MTRYRPRLIVTQSDAHHEHILAAAAQGQSPWPIVWTRRALQMPQLEEATALDLLRLLLEVGAVSGLFKKLHQEGLKVFYAIASDAAILYSEGVSLLCSVSERLLVRPPQEALLWDSAPSLEYAERFQDDIQSNTRCRVLDETTADRVQQRIYQAANDFDRTRRDLVNARARLQDQLKSLDEMEQEARRDIEQELHLLLGRLHSLDRTNALELLTDYGLLPNYAFPERGVRFYGAVYNRHRGDQQAHQPVELARSAGTALRELAPHNMFYTHSRQFEIQQIATGNAQQSLIEKWAICGVCGHMRRADELGKPEASPGCP